MYKVYDTHRSGPVKGRGPTTSPTFRNWGGISAFVRRGLLLMLILLILSVVMVITACRQLGRSCWAGGWRVRRYGRGKMHAQAICSTRPRHDVENWEIDATQAACRETGPAGAVTRVWAVLSDKRSRVSRATIAFGFGTGVGVAGAPQAKVASPTPHAVPSTTYPCSSALWPFSGARRNLTTIYSLGS